MRTRTKWCLTENREVVRASQTRTLRECSERFGVSPSAISRWRKEAWVKKLTRN